MGDAMTESDRELNDLLAKRLLADVAATATLQKHFDEAHTVPSGAYHGAGGQTGAGGFVRSGVAK